MSNGEELGDGHDEELGDGHDERVKRAAERLRELKASGVELSEILGG